MQNTLIDELQEVLSLLWIHIKSNPEKHYPCDERTYSRYLQAVQKGKAHVAIKQEPVHIQQEHITEDLEAVVTQKSISEKLLPKEHQAQTVDVTDIRKELEAIQGMPSLTKTTSYPEKLHVKTMRWAFFKHFLPADEKEVFFQSVIKAVQEKLSLHVDIYPLIHSESIEKLPLIADEHDFLFFFIDQHIEEGFIKSIQHLIEPIQGASIIPPFVIHGKIQKKPVYSLILQPSTHMDSFVKKQLWNTLKLFHSQYT
jgi:hypothetical protein